MAGIEIHTEQHTTAWWKATYVPWLDRALRPHLKQDKARLRQIRKPARETQMLVIDTTTQIADPDLTAQEIHNRISLESGFWGQSVTVRLCCYDSKNDRVTVEYPKT